MKLSKGSYLELCSSLSTFYDKTGAQLKIILIDFDT